MEFLKRGKYTHAYWWEVFALCGYFVWQFVTWGHRERGLKRYMDELNRRQTD